MKTGIVSATAVLAFAILLTAPPPRGSDAAASEDGAPASPHEAVVKEVLTTLEQAIAALITIKDESSADAARPDLKKAGARLKELSKRARDMKQPDREEKELLEKKYKGKFEEVLKKLRDEQVRVRAIPGGPEAVKEIGVEPAKGKKKKDDGPAKQGGGG
jgi:hypothetical protein